MINKIWILFLMTLTFSSFLWGEKHGAHVHGQGEMEIVLTETSLEMTLEIPGMDLVGFEHAPMNTEEEAQIAAAIKIIENADNPLILVKARRSADLTLESVELIQESHEHDANEVHDVHEVHNAYLIHFHYTFSSSSSLKQIEMKSFFKEFTSLEKIHWTMITPREQRAGTATPSDRRIQF